MSSEPIPIRDPAELESALAEPLAVLYKHSPLCGLSDRALHQVRDFMADNPDVPVYLVDVIRARPLSREVEQRFSIRHESPQAFVLRRGTIAWHGSHQAVTAETLARETGSGA